MRNHTKKRGVCIWYLTFAICIYGVGEGFGVKIIVLMNEFDGRVLGHQPTSMELNQIYIIFMRWLYMIY